MIVFAKAFPVKLSKLFAVALASICSMLAPRVSVTAVVLVEVP
jgi:hypothetical protein